MSDYRGRHTKPRGECGANTQARGRSGNHFAAQAPASGHRAPGCGPRHGAGVSGLGAPRGAGAAVSGPRRPQREPQPRRGLKRSLVLAAMIAITAVAGTTIAWFSETDALTNLFDRAFVNTAVEEQFDGPFTVKENVTVKNNGSMTSYLRATVSIYWEDADGKQLWEAPVEGKDYTIAWGKIDSASTDAHWMAGKDGFYYWSQPIDRDLSTAPLIVRVEQTANPADGRKLVVDVASQAIQSESRGGNTFAYAWGDASGLVADRATGALKKK